ncbi:DUF952 domain-containing protein [Sneathiella sp. P13V-1]|uniref:DUF952 domain-containing protein n=1 Tax=Sneathiella sp. P13V-1 TaxID=2697366 RepID=UPI00187BBC38|nr:DUF952 domain-containing protein [Sneathiella sp. P13V-1]MBE7636468.1 DUF952 domain-containing protein [Sneathiella sp. P13V-1]
MTLIYHMANRPDWEQAVKDGKYEGTAMDKADGYMHFSTAETIKGSAAKHRAGEMDLVLITVNSEKMEDKLVWEPARGGILFPHLYEALDVKLVDKVEPLPLGDDGVHIFPELG